MENGITLTNLGEFRQVMNEYREVSKRDDVTILNTKGFYIARGSAGITHRADPAIIRMELENLYRVGKNNKTVSRFTDKGKQYEVPLIALLINQRRGEKGLPGLQGADMAKAVKSFLGTRVRSAAFIAAGWLPAVKGFEPLAERNGPLPRLETDVKQYGRRKGGFQPARESDYVPKAVLENYANARGDKKGALEHYAGAALATAMRDETASMKEYIERKKQKTADRFNAK